MKLHQYDQPDAGLEQPSRWRSSGDLIGGRQVSFVISLFLNLRSPQTKKYEIAFLWHPQTNTSAISRSEALRDRKVEKAIT